MIRIAIPSLTSLAFHFDPYFEMYPNEVDHFQGSLSTVRGPQTGEFEENYGRIN